MANDGLTLEYRSWASMKSRCNNPRATGYSAYGGRGIRVCDKCCNWKEFKSFIADMGLKPSPEYSLDRIDVNGNYCKYNCRWANRHEQAANRRTYADREWEYLANQFTPAERDYLIGVVITDIKRLERRLKIELEREHSPYISRLRLIRNRLESILAKLNHITPETKLDTHSREC